MKAEAIKRVGVVGAGTMGNGIAHVFAQSGYAVTLCDRSDENLQRALKVIDKNLDRLVKKEKITEGDKASTLKRVTTTTAQAELKDCQLVVEAVYESLAVKEEIFRELGALLPAEAILASNTSSLPITLLASSTGR
ncbi:MAG TPA: 3-hydroxyacyl-CoA dehydrogenase NAD-binding domain-containing protein, partial [candidate division Zixibacteria bacterium]|nr:3-hydroxyacyl-CoA dehydrogenase NAD-binding domain-containing protein [candidate division Zixibacteria bacterium]